MNSKIKIVVVGSINMDLVIATPRIPLIGETIKGRDSFTGLGGKGANQAVAASRLGADVEMIGCVGDDQFGEELLSKLKSENVGVGSVNVIPGVKTGQAFIIINDEGDNSIVLSPGANAELTPVHIQQREKVIKNADILLVQLEIPTETAEEAVKIANKYNVTTILNPALASKLSVDIFEKIDILTPNETEGNLLLNDKPNDNLTPQKIVKKLNSLGVKKVILTQGKDGVSYNDGDFLKKSPSFKVDVVDTTAAGDSFNAGLAVALAEGKSYSDSIAFAQSVAAITITSRGATSSLPFRNQVEKVYYNT
jgi:ribokinase